MNIADKFENVENFKALEKALAAAATEEEMVQILAEHGVELTAEEIRELASRGNEEGELSEEDLDMVAGGNAAVVIILMVMVYTYYKIKKMQQQSRGRR